MSRGIKTPPLPLHIILFFSSRSKELILSTFDDYKVQSIETRQVSSLCPSLMTLANTYAGIQNVAPPVLVEAMDCLLLGLCNDQGISGNVWAWAGVRS